MDAPLPKCCAVEPDGDIIQTIECWPLGEPSGELSTCTTRLPPKTDPDEYRNRAYWQFVPWPEDSYLRWAKLAAGAYFVHMMPPGFLSDNEGAIVACGRTNEEAIATIKAFLAANGAEIPAGAYSQGNVCFCYSNSGQWDAGKP